jgi:hypothetical protein
LFNSLPKMLSKNSHNDTQQDQDNEAPKYPSPRFMTAAIDRRFFGPLIHQATAASWELKCVERAILCYAKEPIMPELRTSDDPSPHDGER